MVSSLEKAIQSIVEVADPDVIILFGSRAQEKDTIESDYDFLVIKKNAVKPREITKEIYLNFRNIGAPVDVIVVDMDKFERLKKDPYLIYHQAAREGKVVYEKSG
ncbi:nucleotidyltransferase domain-containing protein [Candidatus Sumerlaeota bacterium]|nr:nucleotidyltransferase domain-containing protein [Candidatus Sumerlaeota bacterium]